MPLPMFQNKVYLFCTVVMFLIGIAMMGAMFNLPFFLQGAQGISATNSGLVTLPMSIGVVPASIITGQILARTGRYKPLAIHRWASERRLPCSCSHSSVSIPISTWPGSTCSSWAPPWAC